MGWTMYDGQLFLYDINIKIKSSYLSIFNHCIFDEPKGLCNWNLPPNLVFVFFFSIEQPPPHRHTRPKKKNMYSDSDVDEQSVDEWWLDEADQCGKCHWLKLGIGLPTCVQVDEKTGRCQGNKYYCRDCLNFEDNVMCWYHYHQRCRPCRKGYSQMWIQDATGVWNEILGLCETCCQYLCQPHSERVEKERNKEKVYHFCRR